MPSVLAVHFDPLQIILRGLACLHKTINCDSTGQGSGSCDVGVILAARDFILKGPTNAVLQVGWKYTQMRKLRKQLMIQIIAWASA